MKNEIYGITYLRGLAVVIVLLYHLKVFDEIYFLQGGFLGVDIFFVISGYILSAALLEIKISFDSIKTFYNKRIRRIIPMYLIVIASTTFISNEIFSNFNYFRVIETANSSLFGTLNYYFIHNGVQYGQDSSIFYPLLHLWSLSIEIQFYLLLPFIVFFIKYFSKISLILLIFLIILSASYQIFLEYSDFKSSYFSTLARIWQPLLGLLLALIQKLNLISRIRKKLKANLSIWFLIGLVFLCIIFSNVSEIGRTWYSLVICLCTMIFIDKAVSSNKKYYSLIPLSYLGLISYSLYLWHYPIYTIINFIYLEHWNEFKPYFSIVLTVIISTITYYLIEKSYHIRKKLPIFFIIISIFVFIICLKVTAWNYESGNLQRVDTYPHFIGEWKLNNEEYRSEWSKLRQIDRVPIFKKKNINEKNILIIGNSHAADTYNMFHMNKELFPNYNFEILRGIRELGDANYHTECLINLIKSRTEFCKGIHFFNARKLYDDADILMISNQWYGDKLDITENGIKLAIKDNKKIVLLGNTVQVVLKKDPNSNLEFNLLDFFILTNKRFPNQLELFEIEQEQYLSAKKGHLLQNEIMEMAKRNGVHYLDKRFLFCNKVKKICITTTKDKNNNVKISFDYGHLTLEGAKYLGEVARSINFLDSINSLPKYNLFFEDEKNTKP